MDSYLKSLQANTPSYGGLFKPTKYKSLSGLSGSSPSLSLGGLNKPKSSPVQSSTPSSTSPQTPAITPPKNDARDAYVSTVASTPQLETPEYTSYLQNRMTEMGIGSNAGGNTNTGSSTPPPSVPETPAPKKTTYLDAYRDYLSQYAESLKPSDEVRAASKNLADISSRIDERSLKARREYEATLDTPGMLKAGAEAAARQGERRNASELADLAVAQGSAARTLQALTGLRQSESEALKTLAEFSKPMQFGDSYIDPTTGEVVYEKPKETSFSLSEGQVRYELDPVTGQYKEIANVPKTYAPKEGTGVIPGFSGSLSPLAQAVQNGTITIDKIPAAQRAQVAAELATFGSQSGRQQTLDANLGIVNELLNNPSLSKISGIPGVTAFLPGTSAQLAKNLYNQLKGILSLENREKMKGSGAISDFEAKLLGDAASALGRNLSDADFKAQLEKIRDVFSGRYAQTNAGGTNPAPATNTTGDADYQAYLRAIAQ